MLSHSDRENDSRKARADLSAAQRGDMKAFNRLIAAHQDQIYTLSYRALGEEPDAVEATQAAVQQAAQNIASFRAGPFRLWLLQWVVSSCQERIGYQGRLHEAGATFSTPEHTLATVAAQTIEAGLCRLPADMRLALILVDVAGLDYAEAATVLGASREQVSRSVAEARARLMAS
jgi:RNA polymerase sigma-70 factor (ECF subfamily)